MKKKSAEKTATYTKGLGFVPSKLPPILVIYISGPMRGVPKHNFPAFDAARDRFRAWGWDVISPADMDRLVGITERTRAKALTTSQLRSAIERDCTALIWESDAIALLPGWQDSAGARVEFFLALFLGLPVFDAITGEGLDCDVMVKSR